MLRKTLTAAVLAALLTATITCDLFNPRTTTHFQTNSSAADVFARNDTLLVAAGDSGLLAFDISKPKAPRELWRAVLGGDCRCVIADGAAAYVGTDSGVVVYQFQTGDRTRLNAGGTSQVVTGLTADSDRLYAATADGITVFDLTSPEPIKYLPVAGEPTGLARRDSRLFVSLRDWGVRVLNVLPGDSLVLDTLRLGRHTRAEGVTASAGGYCIISQAHSGVVIYYSPTPDTVRMDAGGGGFITYASTATDGVQEVSIYTADSSTVMINKIIKKPGESSFSGEVGPDLSGFTRRICLGGNGYVYTASGDAGVYIIRE
ncbi:MAG: hypothetical protein NTX53_18295 [candidate division WOR-3 bacterium]|nr:hypothetical protein [candidate division WOR-3 bacterium]